MFFYIICTVLQCESGSPQTTLRGAPAMLRFEPGTAGLDHQTSTIRGIFRNDATLVVRSAWQLIDSSTTQVIHFYTLHNKINCGHM